MPRALITGISGQDAAYLAKFLLSKGYEVVGAQRRTSTPGNWRLLEWGILDQIEIVPIELLEFSNILRLVQRVEPDELYNLAAQSFVAPSFEQPIYTSDVNGLGVARLLEAVRTVNPAIRFYQASTSEMFGKVRETPQNELTPFYPRSPYAAAKLYAHCMVVNYRESHGIHATSGIGFNHESPLRGLEFVTRKITYGLARIRHEQQDVLSLGNLNAKRDWGYAADYVEGMWLMLQQPEASDYVLATGRTYSIRDFIGFAAPAAGFDIDWKGEGEDTRGIDRRTGRTIIRVDPAFYRPAEVDLLLGNARKARLTLGWEPKVDIKGLATMMMEADLARVSNSRIGEHAG